jgi:hypothetical protein
MPNIRHYSALKKIFLKGDFIICWFN